jgi:Flp pilus assembly protein TadD
VARKRTEEELLDDAWHALEEADYESAAELGEQVLLRTPDDPDARHVVGAALLELGEPTAAIAHLERAHASIPEDAEILADLGGAQFESLRFKDARATLAKALELECSKNARATIARRGTTSRTRRGSRPRRTRQRSA